MFTTYALYYVELLGFNPLQLVLVGTAVELAAFLFEIPTGVVADLYSRRLSVWIGTLAMGAAYLLQGGAPFYGGLLSFFTIVVVAEIIRGIGWTFISGAEEAWIADEVGTEAMGRLHLRAGRISRAAGLAAIGISVLLANIALNLPYLVGGGLIISLGLFLVLTMPETAFQRADPTGRSTWQSLSGTFKEGLAVVRGQPVLMALLLVGVIGGAASEGIDRLWNAHFLITFSLAETSRLTPATWFGVLQVSLSLLGIALAFGAERLLDLKNPRVVTLTLLLTAGLRTASLLLFALAASLPWAVGAFLFYAVLGAIYHPVHRTWINSRIESRTRSEEFIWLCILTPAPSPMLTGDQWSCTRCVMTLTRTRLHLRAPISGRSTRASV